MTRRPPRSTRTYTLCPEPTLFRSPNTDQPIPWVRRSSASRPSRELPCSSLPGDQTQTEARPGTTPRMPPPTPLLRSEEHTSELQSLMRTSYAVFCLKKKRHLYRKAEQTHTPH